MQRCKRSVLLEVRDHRFIDDDRPVIFRPAVDNPMPNRDEIDALRRAKPGSYKRDGGGHVGNLVPRIGFVDKP